MNYRITYGRRSVLAFVGSAGRGSKTDGTVQLRRAQRLIIYFLYVLLSVERPAKLTI